jgi:DNA/RNA endonuclease YhcR with UshA esterase domain
MQRGTWLLLSLLALVVVCRPAGGQNAVIPDAEAASHVGETATVEGVVANVFTSRAGNTFLNFGKPYPDQTFTAVVFRSAAGRFSDLHGWEGKRARVTGRIKLYHGRPEIVLEQPNQLQKAPSSRAKGRGIGCGEQPWQQCVAG